MRCTLNINIDLLKNGRPIAYKYVIRSPNRKGFNPYDFLHAPTKKYNCNINRCLIVPTRYCHQKGTGSRIEALAAIVHTYIHTFDRSRKRCV